MAEATDTTDKPPQRQRPRDNVKETLESILVAFILAFVFRAFVVEAFVIPSGSMATTLLGAHMRLRCQECGYDFTVNYPVQTRDDTMTLPSRSGPMPVRSAPRFPERGSEDLLEPGQPSRGPKTTEQLQNTVFSMHCPNCGYKVPLTTPDPAEAATNTPVNYGDRILVLKYLYLFEDPTRWDVVVFKSPSEPESNYSINFIKRLVGLPGEWLMVLDGDVYTCPDPTGTIAPSNRQWTIQRKPRYVQNALWRVVYDNDYYPRNANGRGWVFPWKQTSGTGWNLAGPNGPGRAVSFDNAATSGQLVFDRDANPGTFPLTDWLPYDETKPLHTGSNGLPYGDHYQMDAYEQEMVMRWNVSDIKLQFLYERRSGAGALTATLTKLGHTFTAELLPGKATIYQSLPDGRQLIIGQARLKQKPSDPLFVEFSNVDYRVALRINDREVIASTPQQYAPDLKDLEERYKQENMLALAGAPQDKVREVFPPASVKISADRQSATLTHLSLWRDIYYTPQYHDQSFAVLTNARPDDPIYLHRRGGPFDREYFVLGDNSILSGDARAWGNSVDLRQTEDLQVGPGRVPERFLLGKAFFVYWPAGYRPLSMEAPGVIPNFGHMRFIH